MYDTIVIGFVLRLYYKMLINNGFELSLYGTTVPTVREGSPHAEMVFIEDNSRFDKETYLTARSKTPSEL